MPFRRGNISNAKVTPALVLKMRELYATGEYTQRDFCQMTGLSIAQVGKILRGEAWQQYQQVPHRDEILDSEARLERAVPVEVPTDLQEKLLRELAQVSPPSNEVEAVDKFMQQRREAQSEHSSTSIERSGSGGDSAPAEAKQAGEGGVPAGDSSPSEGAGSGTAAVGRSSEEGEQKAD